MDPKYYGMARNVFAGAEEMFRNTGKLYFSFDSNSAERDIDVVLKIEKSAREGFDLKAAVKNDASGEMIGSISSFQKSTSSGDDERAMQSLLADAAAQLSAELSDYDSKLCAAGTDVFVEAEGFSKDEYDVIKGFLGGLPGVESVKSSEYYGQKDVYTIKYKGFGADLAEAIKPLKLKKSHINIWNYSKFVVKLNNK